MNVYGITYNGLSCMEGSPGFENQCNAEFRKKDHYGFISRQILNGYPKSERSSVLHSESFANEVENELANFTSPLMSAFKSNLHNLYFPLNDGYLNIKYEDGVTEKIENPYKIGEWCSYEDLWTYDKNCRIYMCDKAYFLWITLLDVDREDVTIRVLKLKRTGNDLASYNTTLSSENMLYMCGQNFTFNGIRYDEYGVDHAHPEHRGIFPSHMKYFSDVTELSFSTESCASLVLIEKK
jgi:hypothetical protein